MNSKEIAALLARTPFEPFVIRMVDGRTYEIPAADFLHVTRQGQIHYEGDNPAWINPLVISAIEPLASSAA